MSESLKCPFPLGTSWSEITPVNPRCQAPNPKILCTSADAAPPLEGAKAALTISTSLHSLPTASSQDFRSRNYRLWRALWKPLPCRRLLPRSTSQGDFLRSAYERTGQINGPGRRLFPRNSFRCSGSRGPGSTPPGVGGSAPERGPMCRPSYPWGHAAGSRPQAFDL